MNKRGLGIVIGAILLIILSLLSAGSLWFFVSLGLKKSTSVLDNDCFTVSIEPVSCIAQGYCAYISGEGSYKADVSLKRKVGIGDLTGLRFVFENTQGKFGVADRNVNSPGLPSLKELEGKRYYDEGPGNDKRIIVPKGKPSKLNIVPIVGSGNLCKEFKKNIDCSVPVIAPAPGFTPGNSITENLCCQYPINLSECDIDCNIVKSSAECITLGCSWDGISTCSGNNPPFLGQKNCCNRVPPGNNNDFCNYDTSSGNVQITSSLSSNSCCVDSSCGCYPPNPSIPGSGTPGYPSCL
jgi:hypothetical protein